MAGEWSDGTLFSDGTGWSDGAAAATTRTLQHRRWLYWPAPAVGGPVDISYAPLALIQPPTVLGRAVWGCDVANTDIGGDSSTMCAYIGVAPISGSFNHLTVWFITHATEFAYSAGDGGTIRCSVQTVDGSNNPTGTLIGGSVDYSPGLVAGHWVGSGKTQIQAQFPDLTLSSPAGLTRGQKFAMVFQNVHASPTLNYVGLDHLLQYAGPGDTGMGFNSPDLDPIWDHKQKIGAGAWQSRRGTVAPDAHYTVPIFILRDSTSGNYFAQTFMANLDGKILGGTTVARQLFTPPTTVTVDRAYIMVGRQIVGCTSFRLGLTLGSATTETYLNSNTAFADTDISALSVQPMIASPADQTQRNTQFTGRSVLVTFPAPVTLTSGTQYALLVSTPTSGGIHVHGCGVGSSWWAGRHTDPFGGLAQSGTVSSFSTWTNVDARLPIYLLQGTSVPPAGLLLDTYTTNMHAAYSTSLRMLTSWTGPIIRIIRDSDSTEMDVTYGGTNSVDLTNSALLAFVAGTTARLHTRYDQAGNGRHQTLDSASGYIRPPIYQSGAFVTQNGKLTTLAAARAAYSNATEFAAYTGTALTMIYAGKASNPVKAFERFCGASTGVGFDYATTAQMVVIARNDEAETLAGYRGSWMNAAAFDSSQWFVAGARLTGSDYVLRVGASASSTTATSGSLDVTRWLDSGSKYNTVTSDSHDGGSQLGEQIVWTGDIGGTAVDAIIAALRTYRSAA